nr:immunoglobulin light chain junction region [Macaca mulatta]MOX81082.1 immunoglobulin light chain junction region [Macaca mulatta]MOX81179.1 immunoglobulin light chain junction region [Macaca mulatta]
DYYCLLYMGRGIYIF